MQMLLTLLFLSLFFATAATAEDPIQLPATKDNSIVMVDGEWDLNAGGQGRIRIKGNQHIVAMAFDTSPVAGKRVKRATLVCVQGEQEISGVSISTIATPWDEHRSNGLTAGIDGVEDWGYAGARFPAVCGGNGFTLVHQTNSEIRDGKYHWDVSPAGSAQHPICEAGSQANDSAARPPFIDHRGSVVRNQGRDTEARRGSRRRCRYLYSFRCYSRPPHR